VQKKITDGRFITQKQQKPAVTEKELINWKIPPDRYMRHFVNNWNKHIIIIIIIIIIIKQPAQGWSGQSKASTSSVSCYVRW